MTQAMQKRKLQKLGSKKSLKVDDDSQMANRSMVIADYNDQFSSREDLNKDGVDLVGSRNRSVEENLQHMMEFVEEEDQDSSEG